MGCHGHDRSAFDCCHRELEANRHMNGYLLRWQEELCHYLMCIADNVSKDMNVIEWWAVSHCI